MTSGFLRLARGDLVGAAGLGAGLTETRAMATRLVDGPQDASSYILVYDGEATVDGRPTLAFVVLALVATLNLVRSRVGRAGALHDQRCQRGCARH